MAGHTFSVRRDVNIDTNETTMPHMPRYIPVPQNSTTTTGKAGNQSFQSNSTTTE